MKEQEELAQEKKLLAKAVAELEHTEEEKYTRYCSSARGCLIAARAFSLKANSHFWMIL